MNAVFVCFTGTGSTKMVCEAAAEAFRAQGGDARIELLRADRAVICRDELRATLTMRLTALGTEVLNPQDGGSGLTVQIRLRGGASAVM